MTSPWLFDNRPVHPGKLLRQMMEGKGWTQEELAAVTGCSRQTLYSILAGKSNISAEMALKLSAAFGNSAEEWLKWDNLYRLSIAETDATNVEKMARFYEIAPIREMVKRGWIRNTTAPSELEAELKSFFDAESLEADLAFPVAAKRTIHLPYLNPAERAWCFRARKLAMSLIVAPFVQNKLDRLEQKLRQLAAYPKEARNLSKVFAEYGIRFVVIEPIPGVKIDGAVFWIESEPCIAISLRHDRIDGFWFTVMHEVAHIRNGDAFSFDTDLIDGLKGIAIMLVEDEAERLANERAVSSLVPKAELESFIRRVGPYYSRERVVQFAHKVKIHPGIVVGQLQHRNELGYSALRDMLVKVRDVVTSTALTDGWNQNLSPGLV